MNKRKTPIDTIFPSIIKIPIIWRMVLLQDANNNSQLYYIVTPQFKDSIISYILIDISQNSLKFNEIHKIKVISNNTPRNEQIIGKFHLVLALLQPQPSFD